MPQLEVATYASQLFWLAVIFGILYVILARVALPRIATVVEERRDKIADDLDEAAILKRQSEEAIQAYETALAEARAKAIAMAQETRDKLQAETDQQRAKLEAELAAKIDEAEARIREVKEAALSNVQTIASEAAETIVEQLLGEKPDSQTVTSAVDAEMKA